MFLGDRKEILSALEKIRKEVCVYSMQNHCDCKFGLGSTEKRAFPIFGSEKSGCPELRSAISILSTLTDSEWDRVVTRFHNREHIAYLKSHRELSAGRGKRGDRK